VPALLVLAVWLIIQPLVIERSVTSLVPDSIAEEIGSRGLVMTEVRRLAEGLDTAIEAGALTREEARTLRTELTDIRAAWVKSAWRLAQTWRPRCCVAAQEYRAMKATGQTIMTVVVLVLAALGLAYAYARTHQEFRARNAVEYAILALLMLASTIAILTTVGIVLSMLFETFNFFELYPWREFFFGLEWRPSFEGGSDLGLVPLLWGTLYISIIALLVAVPIGLFAAVYMAEYASKRMRSVAKPLIEILAGIPTIVYGLFALITVGPLLRDYFAEPWASALVVERHDRRDRDGHHADPLRVVALATTSSTRCPNPCATGPTASARRNRRRSSRSSCPPPFRGSWVPSCWPPRAQSARR
jgi:phosphate transport system permease protein